MKKSPKTFWYVFTGYIGTDTIDKLINFIFEKIHQNQILNLYLYISSIGGDIDSAIRFYDLVHAMDIKLTSVGFGQVDSSAVLLLLTGKDRLIHQDCRIYLHSPEFISAQNYQPIETHQQQIILLNKLNERYLDILSDNLPLSKEKISQILRHGKLLVGEEAVTFGFATKVVSKIPIVTK